LPMSDIARLQKRGQIEDIGKQVVTWEDDSLKPS
jgi:hypothetical protein